MKQKLIGLLAMGSIASANASMPDYTLDDIADEAVVESSNPSEPQEASSCQHRYIQHLMSGKKRTKVLRVSLIAGTAVLASSPMLVGAGVAFAGVAAGAAVSGGAGAVPMMVGAGFGFGGITTAGAISSLWEPKVLSGLEKGIIATQWATNGDSTAAPKFISPMIKREINIILDGIKNDIEMNNPNESRQVIQALYLEQITSHAKEISTLATNNLQRFLREKLADSTLCPEGEIPLSFRKIKKLHKKYLKR